MGVPDALDGACADTHGFAIIALGPVVCLDRWIGPGERHDTFGDLRPKWWDARGSHLIVQDAV